MASPSPLQSSSSTLVSTDVVSSSFNQTSLSAIFLCNIKNLVPIVHDYTNYTLWRGLFLPVFKGYGVYGFIDGSFPCPEPTILNDSGTSTPNPTFQQWTRLDSIILSWIQATISQEILQKIIKPNQTLTSRDAWIQIEQLLLDQRQSKATQLDAKKKILQRRICKHSEKRPFIRFGPLYGPGEDEIQEKKIQAAKDEVWQSILRSSPGTEEDTKALYIYAIRSTEAEARDCYSTADRSFLELTGTDFRMMMIKDGCFFLQLSLCILEVHFPVSDHKLLGELLHNQKQQCLASVFHVGNQIPLLVIKTLTKQSYFQQVIARHYGNWKRSSSNLAKMALYDFVLLPAMIDIETEWRTSSVPRRLQLLFTTTKIKAKQQQPSDVLHELHQLILGPENNKIEDKQVDNTDDNDVVETDLEAGYPATDQSTPILRKTGDSTSAGTSDQKKEFKSASELKQAGIKFKAVEGVGIRGIRFKRWFYPFDPCLYLTPFLVDANSKLLLQSLEDYETAQKFDENQREVTSYLKFMHELIQTSEDARVLYSNGIIQGSWSHTERVPRILKEIAGEEEITSPKLRLAKFQINYFDRPPWVTSLAQYISVMFVLTVLQTFYTMYQYYKPNS